MSVDSITSLRQSDRQQVYRWLRRYRIARSGRRAERSRGRDRKAATAATSR